MKGLFSVWPYQVIEIGHIRFADRMTMFLGFICHSHGSEDSYPITVFVEFSLPGICEVILYLFKIVAN